MAVLEEGDDSEVTAATQNAEGSRRDMLDVSGGGGGVPSSSPTAAVVGERPRSAMSTVTVSDEVSEIAFRLRRLPQTEEFQDNLRLFVSEWREQTKRDVADLHDLKERVAQRKVVRREEDELLRGMREREEELRVREVEEAKVRKQADKLRRMEEAEKRRQKLIEEEKNKGARNFAQVARKDEEKVEDVKGEDSRKELSKDELLVLKTAALSVRVKPLQLEGLKRERLKRKAEELWADLVKLETERYDLEEVAKRQEYDFKELKERQKQQLRQKAMKLGLPPEALMGKYPPKIMVASKYERRAGLKPFGETKSLFEGGFVKERRERTDKVWEERQDLFTKRDKDQLPPWLEDMPRRVVKQMEEEEEQRRLQQQQQEEEEQRQQQQEEEEEEEQRRRLKEAEEEEEELQRSSRALQEEQQQEDEEEEEEEEEEEVPEEESESDRVGLSSAVPVDPNVILEDPEGEEQEEEEEEEEEEED